MRLAGENRYLADLCAVLVLLIVLVAPPAAAVLAVVGALTVADRNMRRIYRILFGIAFVATIALVVADHDERAVLGLMLDPIVGAGVVMMLGRTVITAAAGSGRGE